MREKLDSALRDNQDLSVYFLSLKAITSQIQQQEELVRERLAQAVKDNADLLRDREDDKDQIGLLTLSAALSVYLSSFAVQRAIIRHRLHRIVDVPLYLLSRKQLHAQDFAGFCDTSSVS